VLELLSHVNKRVRGHEEVHLPLEQLLALFRGTPSPMVRNFALVYVEMAFQRTSEAERSAAIAPLLAGIAERPAQQVDMLLRMAVAGLEALAVMPHAHALGSSEEFAARCCMHRPPLVPGVLTSACFCDCA
jgi:proteasome component ECM29